MRTEKTKAKKTKYYEDLIKGGVELNKVVSIERQESGDRKKDNNISINRKGDVHNISNKFADFTLETIDELIGEGFCDAITKLSETMKK